MSLEESLHVLKLEELKEIYDFALSLGRRAGQILLDSVEKRCGEESGREQGQEEKESAVDIVTQADLGASFSPVHHYICFRICRSCGNETDPYKMSKRS